MAVYHPMESRSSHSRDTTTEKDLEKQDEEHMSPETDTDLEKQESRQERAESPVPTQSRAQSQRSRTRSQSQPPLQRWVSNISFRRHRSQPGEPAWQVAFDEGDPENPKTWSNGRKAWITLQLGFLALVGSAGSSIVAPAEPVISEYVGVTQEITVLVVALYVLGFAVGPIAWAPISEV